MTAEEKNIEQIRELIAGFQNGEFEQSAFIPEKYTYGHLVALFRMKDKLHISDSLYRQLYGIAMECCTAHLRAKAQNREVISVAFMSYSAAQWPAEKLYRDLEKDERFDPYIIVSPLTNREAENSVRGYRETLKWYEENGYRVFGGLTRDGVLAWDKLGGFPDIVVHLSTWYECIPEEQQLLKFPWRCANIFINYGMETTDNAARNYAMHFSFNKDFINVMWRIYADSELSVQNYQRYGLLEGVNVRYSGYLKMDELIRPRTYSEEEVRSLWKCPNGNTGCKKIIIAPHYTVGFGNALQSSTLMENYNFWIYLAQKYQESVSILFKPHPNLRGNSVQKGMFTSFEEYDSYINLWNSLPNARAIDESSYIDYFATSDAMITDSCSFIGEYMYAHRPLLYLTRDGQGFTELGDRIMESYYQSPGWDYRKIERFITETVLGEKDPMREKREEVFEKHLNYERINQRLAHETIYAELTSFFEG